MYRQDATQDVSTVFDVKQHSFGGGRFSCVHMRDNADITITINRRCAGHGWFENRLLAFSSGSARKLGSLQPSGAYLRAYVPLRRALRRHPEARPLDEAP